MKITAETYKELKRLTGIKQADVARKFELDRQVISKDITSSFNIGNSLIHQNAHKYMIMTMANLKIKELQNQIKEIEEFRDKVIKED